LAFKRKGEIMDSGGSGISGGGSSSYGRQGAKGSGKATFVKLDDTIVRNYKNNFFVELLMNVARAIEVFNALTGCNVNPDITDILYFESTFKNAKVNDIGFVMKWFFAAIFEHQSTWNPNMPFRLFEYINNGLNQNMIELGLRKALYSTALVEKPQIVAAVFYIGKSRRIQNSERRIKFSDGITPSPDYVLPLTYPDVGGPPQPLDFEIIVVDLLDPSSAALLEKSPTLKGYTELIQKIYAKLDKNPYDLKSAVKEALDECIAEGSSLKDYFMKKREECEGMLMEDLTIDELIRIHEENAEELGKEEAFVEMLKVRLAKGDSLKSFADYHDLDLKMVEELYQKRIQPVGSSSV
jgi:hypothetical protein